MKYVVQNYAATSCTVDPAAKELGTLELARKEVKRRLGVSALRAERLVEREGAIEAYRVIAARGELPPANLGGVEIVKVLKGGAARPAKPPDAKRTPDAPGPRLRVTAAALLQAIDDERDERMGLSFVPDVVRRFPKSAREQAKAALLALSKGGAVELRPEGGLGRLSAEELELSLPGPQKTRLTWARRADASASKGLCPNRTLKAIEKVRTGIGRARLADVKRELGSPDHDEFSRVLLELQREGRVLLMRNDNPQDLGAADHEAAIVIAGHPRHLVYLDEPHARDTKPKPATSNASRTTEQNERLIRAAYERESKKQRSPDVPIADVVDASGLPISTVHQVLEVMFRSHKATPFLGEPARASKRQLAAAFPVDGRPHIYMRVLDGTSGGSGREKQPTPGDDAEHVLAVTQAADRKEREAGRWSGPAMLSIRLVREAAKLPKERFDAAMLALSKRGLLSLHYHDYPASLSPAERDALVKDSRGAYYIGASLKERR